MVARMRMQMMRAGLVAIGLAAAIGINSAPVTAHTMRMVDYVCPIDGEKFSAATTMSYTVFGQRLDGRPIGALPVPTMHPVCPTSGFMMYKAEFSAEEIGLARRLVESDEYRRLKQTETPHFLAAVMAERVGEPVEMVAYMYQEAAWGVEGEGARHDRYLRAAIGKIQAFLDSLPADDKRRIYARVRIVELLRQVGDFAAAEDALAALSGNALAQMPRLATTLKELRARIAARDPIPM